MMRLFFSLGALVLTALSLMWISHYPGTLTLHWMGINVEVSTTLFVCIVIVILFGSTLAIRFGLFLWRLPRKIQGILDKKRFLKAEISLLRAIDALAACSPVRVLTHVPAIRAGFKGSALPDYLDGQGHLIAGDFDAAESCFNALAGKSDYDALRFSGLAFVYAGLGLYSKSLSFLEKAITQDKSNMDYPARAAALCDRLQDNDKKRQYLESLYKSDPNTATVVSYADALIAAGQGGKAASVLKKAYAGGPDRRLAAAYLRAVGAIESGPLSPPAAFKAITDVVGGQDDHTDSLLVLALFAIAARMWGLSRTYLNQLRDRDILKTPDGFFFCTLMARLEAQGGQDYSQADDWRDKQMTLMMDQFLKNK